MLHVDHRTTRHVQFIFADAVWSRVFSIRNVMDFLVIIYDSYSFILAYTGIIWHGVYIYEKSIMTCQVAIILLYNETHRAALLSRMRESYTVYQNLGKQWSSLSKFCTMFKLGLYAFNFGFNDWSITRLRFIESNCACRSHSIRLK